MFNVVLFHQLFFFVFFPAVPPPGLEAGRWRTGPRGQAILGQTVDAMIADADWPGLSQPPQNLFVDMLRPKHVQSLPVVISVLSLCSFATAKNTHTPKNLQHRMGNLPAVSRPLLSERWRVKVGWRLGD